MVKVFRRHHTEKQKYSARINAVWHGGMRILKMCRENPSRFLFALFAVKISLLMQVQSRGSVQENVTVFLRGLLSMKDKYQTIFQYQSVMAWVRSLLNDGIITQSEYNKIDTNIAKRYGISSCSIFR